MEPFRTQHSGDRFIDTLQRNLQEFFLQFVNNPLLSGVLLENQVLTTGNNNINHGLGRPHRGYIVVKQNAAANFYDNSTTTNVLTINSSAGVTVSIYIF